MKKRKGPARDHMLSLIDMAGDVFSKDRALANRYVKLSRDIAMKMKLRYPREYKRKFCKHCYSYLMPGVNCRVRTHEGKVVYYCFECRKHMRFPYR